MRKHNRFNCAWSRRSESQIRISFLLLYVNLCWFSAGRNQWPSRWMNKVAVIKHLSMNRCGIQSWDIRSTTVTHPCSSSWFLFQCSMQCCGFGAGGSAGSIINCSRSEFGSVFTDPGSGSRSVSLLFIKDIKKFRKKVQHFIMFNDLLPVWQHRYPPFFCQWPQKYPGGIRTLICNLLASWIRIRNSRLRSRELRIRNTGRTTCPFILLLGKLFAGCQVRAGDERIRGEVQARVRREAQQGGVRQGAQADALG